MPPVTTRRPRAVWVITFWLGFSAITGLLSLLLLFTGTISLSPDQQKVITALGPENFVGNVLESAITGFSAILLFRLRKSSVIACSVTLVFDLILSMDDISRAHFDQIALAENHSVLIIKMKMLLDLLLMGGVFIYARSLRRAGVLT